LIIDAWEKRWIASTHKGEAAGKFVLTAGKFYGDATKDLGELIKHELLRHSHSNASF